MKDQRNYLMLEPFYGGSHQQFCEALSTQVRGLWTMLTLPARHWKWHSRSCVSHWRLTKKEVLERTYDMIFASSLVPICELKVLNPNLSAVPTILYCHENQFTYPNQNQEQRDMHYAFSQLVNFQAADLVIFNSEFNRSSFLRNAGRFLDKMPSCHLTGVLDEINRKSTVLPVLFTEADGAIEATEDFSEDGPIILWNHRWEHDKGPEDFFEALERVAVSGHNFRLSLCGEKFRRVPQCFTEGIKRFEDRLIDAAPIKDRDAYHRRLFDTDIVVSTAKHEFFGLSMLEATLAGAYPLVPNRLVYPEIYPREFLFDSIDDLGRRLVWLIERYQEGESLRQDRRRLFGAFVDGVASRYETVIDRLLACP